MGMHREAPEGGPDAVDLQPGKKAEDQNLHRYAKPAFSNLSQFFTPIHFFFLSGNN